MTEIVFKTLRTSRTALWTSLKWLCFSIGFWADTHFLDRSFRSAALHSIRFVTYRFVSIPYFHSETDKWFKDEHGFSLWHAKAMNFRVTRMGVILPQASLSRPAVTVTDSWMPCCCSCTSDPPKLCRRASPTAGHWFSSQNLQLDSGPRYMICATLFWTLRESNNTRPCENRTRFKRATKSDTATA